MVGIPKFLNTKKDVENVHGMALSNVISRAEWRKRLEKIAEQTSYNIPVLDSAADYVIVPDSELIMQAFPGLYEVMDLEENKKVLKLFIENFEKEYINIPGPYLELERLGISLEEINRMIGEVA